MSPDEHGYDEDTLERMTDLLAGVDSEDVPTLLELTLSRIAYEDGFFDGACMLRFTIRFEVNRQHVFTLRKELEISEGEHHES